jgi:hypothetical protein
VLFLQAGGVAARSFQSSGNLAAILRQSSRQFYQQAYQIWYLLVNILHNE